MSCIGLGSVVGAFRRWWFVALFSLAGEYLEVRRLSLVSLVARQDDLCRLRKGPFWLDVWRYRTPDSHTDFF